MRHIPLLTFILVMGLCFANTGGSNRSANEEVCGMTISCHTWGWEWGTDEMVQSMRNLKKIGVNWISIHPYAGIRKDGTVSSRKFDPDNPPEWLLRPIREAHNLGMEIMIKPHIAYWGSGFSWRGEIDFETEEQWQRFFDGYQSWITDLAKVCKDADAFVVGTELDRTIKHEERWRTIIASVRKQTSAHLTYSANWDMYERVPFWDALDVIGIQAYFPVVNHTNLPEADELNKSWEKIISRLEAFSSKVNKKIVFGELGYNRSSLAAREPWNSKSGGPMADETQRLCMKAALKAISQSDTVVGAFLWKWFPGENSRSNFIMSTENMQKVIKEQWGEEN